MARRGLLPPLFRRRPHGAGEGPPPARRVAALLLLFVVLWGTTFSSLELLFSDAEREFQAPATPALFLIHGILMATLALWFVLGFVGPRRDGPAVAASPLRQFGLRAPSIAGELGLGVVCGVAAWAVVLTLLFSLGAMVWALEGEEALPRQAPEVVTWVAALPLGLRLAISASAGVAEELFFRGFLQPRVGIGLSTALFALAHLSYDQPIMLVGITLLSLAFAYIVRWRQSIWAAMVAHAVFDAIQLTFLIPWVLRYTQEGGPQLLGLAVW